jgi:hypothetical protein
MKYVAIGATITTGNSSSDAVCIVEHPVVAVECATFVCESAGCSLAIDASDTLAGTYYPVYVERANLVVPLVASGFVGGGTVLIDGVGPMKYIKARLVSNTATAACSIRVICRTD